MISHRKHEWRPFEDRTGLEFFCQKNDASLFMFASHSKKRPNNLIIGRTYDGHVLDMIELEVQNYKGLTEFKVPKISVGNKPLIVFSGEQFDVEFDYQRIKSLLLDIFSGPKTDAIRLSGIEYVIKFLAIEGRIHVRFFRISFKKSGTKLPRVELDEMGPRVDFVLRRTILASDDLYKRATAQPGQLKKKKVKNINKDQLGSTFGRIHMERQDYGKLQTRKLKGLKKDNQEKIKKKRTHVPVAEDNNNEDNSNDVNSNDVNSDDVNQLKSSIRNVDDGSAQPRKKVRFTVN